MSVLFASLYELSQEEVIFATRLAQHSKWSQCYKNFIFYILERKIQKFIPTEIVEDFHRFRLQQYILIQK